MNSKELEHLRGVLDVRQYHLLLLYNNPLMRREWLERKKEECECKSWLWKNKTKELILNYNHDIFTFGQGENVPCQVVYKVVQYIPNPNTGMYKNAIHERFAWRFAADQFYFVEYLDGSFLAEDIMYLMCRTRLGVYEV